MSKTELVGVFVYLKIPGLVYVGLVGAPGTLLVLGVCEEQRLVHVEGHTRAILRWPHICSQDSGV